MPAPTIVVGAPAGTTSTAPTPTARRVLRRALRLDDHGPGPRVRRLLPLPEGRQGRRRLHGQRRRAGRPDSWTVYLSTDDADRTVEDAKANGGQVHMEPMDVTQNGPCDARRPRAGRDRRLAAARGEGLRDPRRDRRAPTWFELHTREYDKSVAFYRDVFGWDTHTASDTDEFRYTTLGEGERRARRDHGRRRASQPEGAPAAGRSTSPSTTSMPPSPRRQLGGTVERPAEDTPYGRLATASDPTGTRFKLVGPNVG